MSYVLNLQNTTQKRAGGDAPAAASGASVFWPLCLPSSHSIINC